jgi:hypothetical protein
LICGFQKILQSWQEKNYVAYTSSIKGVCIRAGGKEKAVIRLMSVQAKTEDLTRNQFRV